MTDHTLLVKNPKQLSDIIDRIGTGKFQALVRLLGFLQNIVLSVQNILIGVLAFTLEETWPLSELEVTLFASVSVAGSATILIAVGWLEERLGRWTVNKLGQWIALAFGVLSAFAVEIVTATSFRALSVAGTYLSIAVSYPSLGEMIPSQHRGKVVGLWAYGAIFASLVMPGFIHLLIPEFEGNNWRLLASLSIAIPALPSLILTYYLINDSPIYLSRRHEPAEAIAALNRMADFNNQAQLSEEEELLVYEQLEARMSLVPLKRFFEKAYLKTTLFLILLWLSILFGCHGLMSVYPYLLEIDDDPTGVLYNMLLIGVFEFPVLTVYLCVIDREIIGRKNTLLGISGVCLVAAIIPVFVPGSTSMIISASFIIAFKLVSISLASSVNLEMYNTEMRASGMAYVIALARVLLIGAPYLVLTLVQTGYGLSFIFLAALEALMIAANLFLARETVGARLDQPEEVNDVSKSAENEEIEELVNPKNS